MAEANDSTELTELEQHALTTLTDEIISTRQTRQANVQRCMEGLASADEVTQMVAGICIRHYLANPDGANVLASPRYVHERKVYCRAPGIFMHNGEVTESLLATGEFLMLKDFVGCAEILGFTPTKARHAVEFLYQWVAARNPGSPAESDVRYYGLKSGRMSRSIDRGYFYTEGLLFHESIMQEYAEGIRNGSQNRHADLDPIICLTVTDDPELIYGRGA